MITICAKTQNRLPKRKSGSCGYAPLSISKLPYSCIFLKTEVRQILQFYFGTFYLRVFSSNYRGCYYCNITEYFSNRVEIRETTVRQTINYICFEPFWRLSFVICLSFVCVILVVPLGSTREAKFTLKGGLHVTVSFLSNGSWSAARLMKSFGCLINGNYYLFGKAN